MGEFELIERCFKRSSPPAPGLDLGIGDDCALVSPVPGMQLAISSDMLVEGRHFFPDVPPEALGHKALAVNLSDLAACGASPVGFTLALALPRADLAWVEGFARGLFALADCSACPLMGGDTTAGPLTICITVFGQVPQGMALLRSGAQPGDDVYVSGRPGQARLALDAMLGRSTLSQSDAQHLKPRLERPTPRLALGKALRGIATSAIDVSDGLLGDLSHVLTQSGVGAEISLQAVDRIATSKSFVMNPAAFDTQTLRSAVLAGGDDYELVFTAPAHRGPAVRQAAAAARTPVTRIGRIQSAPGLRLLDIDGSHRANTYASFDHFSGQT